MSRNKRERAVTRDELQANLALTGLSETDVQKKLGLDDAALEAALEVTSADPVDVWLVRDYLERVLLERGVEPRAFTVLTPAARVSAEKWFALYDVEDVLKDAL